MASKRETRKRKSTPPEPCREMINSEDELRQCSQNMKISRNKRLKHITSVSSSLTNKLLPNDMRVLKDLNTSIVKFKCYSESGILKPSTFEKSIKSIVIHRVRELSVFKTHSPFNRRITALVWHPKKLNTLAVGSKGGDIIIWNAEHLTHNTFIQGSGPGGSIQAMKFGMYDDSLYTCSIEGTVCKRDLITNKVNTYLDTGINSTVNWYTSLDLSFAGDLIAAGDNKGFVNMLTKDGNVVWKKRLHRSKVHHMEFHNTLPWLLVTSSLDNLVKLWDVRNIKDANSAFVELQHERGVNAANFSPSHGTRLLTTDQHCELRIYSGPNWTLETRIPHPHRQFQHLTPIKAHWHPLEDIVVVGRYPDPLFPGYHEKEPRCVDFFDASDGELLYQLEPYGKTGIMSLNRFNPIGEFLASAMGQHILLWRRKSLTVVGSKQDGYKPTKTKVVLHPSTSTKSKENDLKKKITSTRTCSTTTKRK